MKPRQPANAEAATAGGMFPALEAAVFEHADVVLFCVAVKPRGEFRFAAVNRAFLKATGLKKGQVAGKLVQEVIPAASWAMVSKHYRRAVRTKQPAKWQETSLYPKGNRHGEVIVTPMCDEKGRVRHLAGMVHDITARKDAEEALQLSESRYARAVRGTQDGVWDWNVQTGEDYHSPRWKELLGFQKDELEDHMSTFFSRVHREDLPRVKAAVRAHLKKRVPYDLELRLRCKDGSYRWFRSRGEAERDAKGRPTCMAGVITDITESKAAEEALRVSEERYRLLADHMEDFVSLNDTKGNRLYISPSFFRKTGWTHELLDKMDWRTRLHPDDLNLVLGTYRANLKGKATTIEHRMRCRDGSWIWVETHCKPIRDEKGRVWRLLVISHDITERRKTEEQFLREQKLSRVLANHPSMLIMVLDAKGRIEQVSPIAAQGLGFRLQEVLGRTPWELGLMEERQIRQSKKRFQKLLAGEPNPPVELRIRTKQGEQRHVELRTATTRNADGTTDRVIVIATDLTERLRMQQEVLRISEQEHARIGSDLHDGVGQTMTGVASLLDALEQDLDGEKKQSAARIRTLLQEAIQDVRRLSHGLSPAAVRHRELSGALRLLADTIRTNFRTDCVCRIAGNVRVTDPEKQMHLFRIAQEAVNNALRHGNPRQIRLTLARRGRQEGVLQIENDGADLPKKRHGAEGIGVRVMDYRASLIGGILQVQNRRGGGVCVTCRFPTT
jgi:PAS domain S-box-containing protein